MDGGRRDTSVDIETKVGLDGPGFQSRQGQKFSSLPKVETDSAAHTASHLKGTIIHSQGIKGIRRDVAQSRPSSTEVRNEWSYDSTPPICIHGVDTDDSIILY